MKKKINNFSNHVRKYMKRNKEGKINIPLPSDNNEKSLTFEDYKKKVPQKYFDEMKDKSHEELVVETFFVKNENIQLVRQIELLQQKIEDLS